jgi:Type IV secretory pathway, VirD4 components
MIKHNQGFFKAIIIFLIVFPIETTIVVSAFLLIDFIKSSTFFARVALILMSLVSIVLSIILKQFNFDNLQIENKINSISILIINVIEFIFNNNEVTFGILLQRFLKSYVTVSFFSFSIVGIAFVSMSLLLYNREHRIDNRWVKREKQKKIKNIKKQSSKSMLGFFYEEKGVDYNTKGNTFVAGTTGAGKTANLLNYTVNALAKKKFIAIIDGKGGNEEYSLYDGLIKLAKKWDRKLYIVNQTDSDKTDDYNPFQKLNPTQLADMLVNMSTWSEEHYKVQAKYFWLTMGQVMKELGIEYSFAKITKYSTVMSLFKLANDNSFMISPDLMDRVQEITVEIEEYESVSASNNRFKVIYYGEGQKLFKSEKGFNMAQAYKENAIVLIMLNEMKYSDFAESLGHLVIDDLKNLIGEVLNGQQDRESLLICDEASVYIDENMLGVVNKARSAGFQSIIATQGVVDIDMKNDNKGEGLRNAILNNCHNFLVLRQNDSESPEVLASVIGTEEVMESTRRMGDELSTGEASKRMVNSFRVHPDDIKSLKDLEGFFYTKSNPTEVIKFRTKFINLNE